MSGRFTGEEIVVYTLILPSLNRILWFRFFSIVKDVGEIHRRCIFLVLSFSPYETEILDFVHFGNLCIFSIFTKWGPLVWW